LISLSQHPERYFGEALFFFFFPEKPAALERV
jgi:hypothetical protein